MWADAQLFVVEAVGAVVEVVEVVEFVELGAPHRGPFQCPAQEPQRLGGDYLLALRLLPFRRLT